MTPSPSIRSVIEAIETAAREFGTKPMKRRQSEIDDIKFKLGYAVELLRQAETKLEQAGRG